VNRLLARLLATLKLAGLEGGSSTGLSRTGGFAVLVCILSVDIDWRSYATVVMFMR